jgi:hypothetical protein
MPTRTTAEKLLIRAGTRLWASHADHVALVAPLPDGVEQVALADEATTALVFTEDVATLRATIADHRGALAVPEALWVAYPPAAVEGDAIWPVLVEHGLRPIARIDVDATWEALRFRPLRPGETFHGRTG